MLPSWRADHQRIQSTLLTIHLIPCFDLDAECHRVMFGGGFDCVACQSPLTSRPLARRRPHQGGTAGRHAAAQAAVTRGQ
jgi:hypothetical protein